MERLHAERLAAVYFRAWLEQEEEAFLGVLDSSIIVEECYGAVYHGIGECRDWFRKWHEPGNRVLAWDILESFFDRERAVLTHIWRFTCLYGGNESTFDGCSVIDYGAGGITRLREFEMKTKKFRPYATS